MLTSRFTHLSAFKSSECALTLPFSQVALNLPMALAAALLSRYYMLLSADRHVAPEANSTVSLLCTHPPDICRLHVITHMLNCCCRFAHPAQHGSAGGERVVSGVASYTYLETCCAPMSMPVWLARAPS